MQTPLAKLALVAVPALALAGCFGSSSSSSSSDPTADLRVFHAASDAPPVDILVDGDPVLEDVPFGAASAFLDVALEPTVTVNVAGTDTTVFEQTLNLDEDSSTTAVARNLQGGGESLDVQILEEPRDQPPSGEARLRVLHVAQGVDAEVDVYLGADDASPTDIVADSDPVVEGLGLGQATDFLSVEEPGPVRIVVTLGGESEVVYDSGPVATVADLNITVAAIDGSRGVSPIATVALTGVDDPAPALEWQDIRPGLRLAHLSPDAGDVDVTLEWGENEQTFSNVSYKHATDYIPLPGAVDELSVTVASGGSTVLEGGLSLDVSTDTTAAVAGLAGGGDPELQFLILADQLRPLPADEAAVRLVHASPEANVSADQGVDVYINAAGTSDYSDDPAILLPGVAFGEFSDYLEVQAGDYRVDVTVADTTPQDPPLTVDPFELEPRDRVTVFAIGDGNNADVEALPLRDEFND